MQVYERYNPHESWARMFVRLGELRREYDLSVTPYVRVMVLAAWHETLALCKHNRGQAALKEYVSP